MAHLVRAIRTFVTIDVTTCIVTAALITAVSADPFSQFPLLAQHKPFSHLLHPAPQQVSTPVANLSYGPSERDITLEQAANLPSHLTRQVVDYLTREAPGTIIVDTPNTYLYFVLGNGKAIRYGIGVGRDGFTWSGTQQITRKAEWPDWIPLAEMIRRQPYLPRFTAGGLGNPLGARALYLGGTAYRIHGTNNPATIGGHVSSGCIRMTNPDVIELYGRVNLGTKVIVLSMGERRVPRPHNEGTANVRRATLPPIVGSVSIHLSNFSHASNLY
jgi:lipoprotein-anchoring transpeptidase ErfK/SrfK